MNYLKSLICSLPFKHHIIDMAQETILYLEFLPGEKWYTECCRCGVGVVVYIEPKHEDCYYISEGV